MAATHDSLCAQFKSLGIRPGDVVMLHSSFRSLGPVEGGPDAVVDGLMDAVGKTGGMIVFVSWGHSTYDAYVKGGGLANAEREAWPAFDPQSASIRSSYAGAIGGCLARRVDALRSGNPDRSLVALGRGAKRLLAEHCLNHGFGPNSPLARFVEQGGKTLLLGAPLSTVSVVHLAEYLCRVPNKLYVRYEVPLMRDGKRSWQQVEQMNRDGFTRAVQDLDEDYIAQVVRAYLAKGRHHPGRVGEVLAILLDAADLVAFAISYFERHYGGEH